MEAFKICPVRYEGRPDDLEGRLAKEQASYALLDRLEIRYDRVDHDPADTIQDCHTVEAVLQTPICKNLFLCNRQKTQFYLLLMEGDKAFKTKELSKQLGCARLSFADADDLQKLLDLTPGSVTVLGLQFDRENAVQLVIDRPVADGKRIGCHLCINTSTVAFSVKELFEKLLPAMGHEPILVDLPESVS